MFVLHQRADAARKAQDARPAFALDLLGAEAKRGNAAIDRQAVAVRRAIERGRDAKNFAPPRAEGDGEAALLAERDVWQRAPRDVIGLVRTLRLHAGDIGVEFILRVERQQRAADRG